MAAVGLDRRVSRPLEEVVVLGDEVRLGEASVDVAELQFDHFGHIPAPPGLAWFVNVRTGRRRDGFVRVEVLGKLLVGHVYQVERGDGRVLVDRCDRCNTVSDVAHLVHAERVLVGRPGDDAVRRGHVAAVDDPVDALQRLGARRVDRHDARVRVGAPQDLAVEHPRERDVVGVAGAAGRLGQPVDLPHGAADGVQGRSLAGYVPPPVYRRGRSVPRAKAAFVAPRHVPSLAAAASTAS